jgi:hypothetical protein
MTTKINCLKAVTGEYLAESGRRGSASSERILIIASSCTKEKDRGEGARLFTVVLLCWIVLQFHVPGAEGQQKKKSTQRQEKNSVGQSAEEREAKQHYKVAQEAMQHGDVDVALEELQKSAVLAPRNAIVWYNIAILESKKNEPKAAMDHLTKAQTLGLPPELQESASDLAAKLSYTLSKMNAAAKISWLTGYWVMDEGLTTRGSGCAKRTSGLRVALNVGPDSAGAGQLRGTFYLTVTYIAGMPGCRSGIENLSCSFEQDMVVSNVLDQSGTAHLTLTPSKAEKKGSSCFGDWDRFLAAQTEWIGGKRNDADIDLTSVFGGSRFTLHRQ